MVTSRSGCLWAGTPRPTPYLDFRFLAYALSRIPARAHFDSANLVARLNLPNMAYAPEDKLEVYARAMRGLTTLEPDPERRLKYLDFIDIYAALDENERIVYRQRYPEEVTTPGHPLSLTRS